MEEELLTAAAVAERLDITPHAVRAAVREGRLEGVMKYGILLISEKALLGFVPRNYRERTDGAKPKGRPKKAQGNTAE